MDTDALLNLINRKFKNVIGIILTGSQVNAPVLNFSTDIDVILIDPRFTVIAAKVVNIDNCNFDFTMIPLTDVGNILRNERYDTKGVLLSMLVKGVILKDNEEGIVAAVKDYATRLYERSTLVVDEAFDKATGELSRLKKDFYKVASYEKRLVNANTFFYLVIQAELARFNWLPSAKHKSDFLFKNNPGFLKEVTSLFEQELHNKGLRDSKEIGNYVDYYLQDRTSRVKEKKSTSRCVLDIRYQGAALAGFVGNILPHIQQHQILGDKYRYFFASPRFYHRLYVHMICIVFETDETIQAWVIYKALSELLESLKLEHINISALPGLIYNDPYFDGKLLLQFEPTARSISEMCVRQLTHNIEDQERAFIISVILLSFLSNSLKISSENCSKINAMLSNAALLTKEEQLNITNENELIAIQNKKHAQLGSYFVTNKNLIKTAFEKGKSYTLSVTLDTGKEYYPIILAIQELLTSEIDHGLLIKNNPILDKLLTDFHIEPKQHAISYILIAKQMLITLNLHPMHYPLCFYAVAAEANERTLMLANTSNVNQ